MSRSTDDIIRILSEIKQQAAQDRSFRAAILKNPVGILQKHGLQVDADTPMVVEFHEAYGLFVAIPTTEDAGRHAADADTNTTLLDHPADDCLHY